MTDLSTRNVLAKALGIFWVIDGLLQFQPKMFGQAFVTNILAPTLTAQPGILQTLIHLGIALWNTNTLWTNTAAALLQTLIGVLIFFPLGSRTFKFGLYLSILWGLIVWVFGEGFGMLFTNSATLYTGAPGGVLVYVVLAALLLIPEKLSVTTYSRIIGWSLVLMAFLQFQPTFWTSNGAQGVFMGSMDSVSFLNVVPTYLGQLALLNPLGTNVLLITVPLVLGLFLLQKPNRTTGGLSLAFLFLVWWLGQDFGMLSTFFHGTSTDPNTAPLFALFIIPLMLQPKEATAPVWPDVTKYLVPSLVISHLDVTEKDRILRVLIILVVVLGVYSITAAMSGMSSNMPDTSSTSAPALSAMMK